METKTYRRYLWLINTLEKYGRLSLSELDELWQRSRLNDGSHLSRRTFIEHKKAIQKAFNINIDCESGGEYRYFIRKTDRNNRDMVQRWQLNAIAINNMLNKIEDLSDRVLLDNVPGGTQHLDITVEAMRMGKVLEVRYQSYYSDSTSIYHLSPYCLRMHNLRWYVLGWIEEKQGVRHVALDRTYLMRITEQQFSLPESFNPEAFYRDFIGVFADERQDAKRIKIRTFGKRTEYMRSLPLHHSQEEIATEDGYSDFVYRLCITPELITELLRQGNQIEVLEPLELREMLSDEINKMAKRYNMQ